MSRAFKQIDTEQGFYIPLSSLAGQIKSISTGGTGAGGAFSAPVFSTAAWCVAGGSGFLSTISSIAAGGILRDMGRSVVSAGRTFRKVQLIAPNAATASTGGVAGAPSAAVPIEDYLTGYIELGFGVGANPAPVAMFGR